MSAADDAAAAHSPHAAGKTAKPAKEGKAGKKSKDDGTDAKGAAAQLRQMAADLSDVMQALSRLRAEVDTLRRSPDAAGDARTPAGSRKPPAAAQAEKQILSAMTGRGDIAIALAAGSENGAAPVVRVASAEELKAVDTVRAARLGYAFSSAPKVSLLRLLLEGGEQSAAQLGEGASLTTGSLYHHLRELVHSEVIHPSGRNKYALTPLGRQAILAVLALAAA